MCVGRNLSGLLYNSGPVSFGAAVTCTFDTLMCPNRMPQLRTGDTVSVLEAPAVKDGTFVRVLPYEDDVENVKGDLIDTLLR